MTRKGYTPEQIIGKLREVEVLVQQGDTIRGAARRIGVSDHTYYVWRKEYGTKNLTGLGQQERHEALGWWMREVEKGMCGTPIHWQAGPQQRPCPA